MVVDAAGNVAAEIAGSWTLVMTDAPASITVNGKPATPTMVALAGLPLAAVRA